MPSHVARKSNRHQRTLPSGQRSSTFVCSTCSVPSGPIRRKQRSSFTAPRGQGRPTVTGSPRRGQGSSVWKYSGHDSMNGLEAESVP
ncbi:MAG: hypothetical protein KF873_19595 [Gemmataceae bacterium]|nr:hypothetical protein [Gemmataceae bacterium]